MRGDEVPRAEQGCFGVAGPPLSVAHAQSSLELRQFGLPVQGVPEERGDEGRPGTPPAPPPTPALAPRALGR